MTTTKTVTASRRQVSPSRKYSDRLIAEASQLELPPGIWPGSIVLVDENDEGVQFTHERTQRDGDGDVMYVIYRAGPTTLVVYND
jgi:hypothetical protein